MGHPGANVVRIAPGSGHFVGCATEDHHWARPPSARHPTSVIRTLVTSIGKRPATTRSVLALASPVLIISTNMSIENPRASMLASVQPSRLPASNSSARRRWREGCACSRCGVGCLPRTLDVLTGRRYASRGRRERPQRRKSPFPLPPPGSRGRLCARRGRGLPDIGPVPKTRSVPRRDSDGTVPAADRLTS